MKFFYDYLKLIVTNFIFTFLWNEIYVFQNPDNVNSNSTSGSETEEQEDMPDSSERRCVV